MLRRCSGSEASRKVPLAERHVEREELVDERAVARLREDALAAAVGSHVEDELYCVARREDAVRVVHVGERGGGDR